MLELNDVDTAYGPAKLANEHGLLNLYLGG